MKQTTLAFLAFASVLLTSAVAARAASPLAAIPIGSSAKFHLTSQSNTPDSGPQSASHYLNFKHTSQATLQVTVDGAPAGTITLEPDGSIQYPTNLKPLLAPFGEIGLFMRGAPQPLSPHASWSANLPVPVQDETDNVPVTVTVQQIGMGGATIAANGSSNTDVQPGVRKFPTNVNVNGTISFTAARTLSSANSTVAITVKMGRFGARDKHFGNSWTITRVQ
jgi:hypothetical protein